MPKHPIWSIGVKNWRTTLAGILTSLLVILGGVLALIDNDPDTVIDSNAVLAALTAMMIAVWAWFTKDGKPDDDSDGGDGD